MVVVFVEVHISVFEDEVILPDELVIVATVAVGAGNTETVFEEVVVTAQAPIGPV